jgi:hypothetical protein
VAEEQPLEDKFCFFSHGKSLIHYHALCQNKRSVLQIQLVDVTNTTTQALDWRMKKSYNLFHKLESRVKFAFKVIIKKRL